jgi:hypothetical protein
MTSEHSVGRRAALKTLGAGASALAFVPWLSDEGARAFFQIQQSSATPALKAMSAAQFRTIEALTEAIIPTDERSPGAKAARVPEYIDLLLSEQDEAAHQQLSDGLKALDAFSEARFQKPFAALDESQTEAALTELSRNEKKPETTEEKFFKAVKNATIHGYYTSEIGIHKELRYQGRKILQEYVGCLTVDGKDCPHCGQKAVV